MESDLTLALVESIMARKNGRENAFGERLRQLRKAKGFTQTELAEAVGTSQRMITHYERHGGMPSGPIVVRLAEVLDVAPEELLGLKRPQRRAPTAAPQNLRLWRKLRQVEQLPPRARQAVLEHIEGLVSKYRNRG